MQLFSCSALNRTKNYFAPKLYAYLSFISHRSVSTLHNAPLSTAESRNLTKLQSFLNQITYKSILDEYKMVLFCQYNNMKFKDMAQIRAFYRSKNIHSKFVTTRDLLEALPADSPLRLFAVGPLILIYTQEPPEALFDTIKGLAGNRQLTLLGGCFENRCFSHEGLLEVALHIRSAAHQHSQLVGLLEDAALRFTQILEQPAVSTVALLEHVAKK